MLYKIWCCNGVQGKTNSYLFSEHSNQVQQIDKLGIIMR